MEREGFTQTETIYSATGAEEERLRFGRKASARSGRSEALLVSGTRRVEERMTRLPAAAQTPDTIKPRDARVYTCYRHVP